MLDGLVSTHCPKPPILPNRQRRNFFLMHQVFKGLGLSDGRHVIQAEPETEVLEFPGKPNKF
jgi:hypothetical protein